MVMKRLSWITTTRENFDDRLISVPDNWDYDADSIGYLLALAEEQPTGRQVDRVIDSIAEMVDEPEWFRFVEQNPDFMFGLTDADTPELVQYAGEHSGNAY